MWRPAEAEVLREEETPDTSIPREFECRVNLLTGPRIASPEVDPLDRKGPQGSNDVRRGLVSFDTYRGQDREIRKRLRDWELSF